MRKTLDLVQLPERKKLPIPATNGTSGPGTTRLTPCSLAKARRPGKSSSEMLLIFVTLPTNAVPPLPGTAYIASTRGDCPSFHAKACSLPPLPTSNMRSCSPSMETKFRGHTPQSPRVILSLVCQWHCNGRQEPERSENSGTIIFSFGGG